MSVDYSESPVRAVVQSYLDGYAAAAHDGCLLLCLEGGDVKRVDALPTAGGAQRAEVRRVHLLDDGSCADVMVQLPGYAGYLHVLRHNREYKVVSGVVASTSPTPGIAPADFAGVTAACWDTYCGANRACDAARMAEVFHPLSRLTYTAKDGTVAIKPQAEFLEMVGARYTTPMHAPYAHLKDDPRVAARDTLVGVEFAAPGLAMVTLKVGHPPCLWLDILTCAFAGGRWWIVAKSSCSEQLLADEARR